MGIRRKVLFGSTLIGILLLLSGIISTLELLRYKEATDELILQNQINIELSRNMLDAAQDQNTALLLNVADSIYTNHNHLLIMHQARFDSLLVKVIEKFDNSTELERLISANHHYSQIISEITDTTSIDWFSKVYKTSYSELTGAIKDFMTVTQRASVQHTTNLERNAHRATMIGIIAIAATLVLVVLFYHMINRVVLSPLLRIQRSLSDYLETRMVFKVTLLTKDEIMTLKDDIVRLIEKSKK